MEGELTPLTEAVMAASEQVISDRRLLHTRPELSFEEYNTTGLIKDVMGISAPRTSAARRQPEACS